MNAKKRTPTGIELQPLACTTSAVRMRMVHLIRQYLAAQGGRTIEELRSNLDRDITEAERSMALSRRTLKGHKTPHRQSCRDDIWTRPEAPALTAERDRLRRIFDVQTD